MYIFAMKPTENYLHLKRYIWDGQGGWGIFWHIRGKPGNRILGVEWEPWVCILTSLTAVRQHCWKCYLTSVLQSTVSKWHC